MKACAVKVLEDGVATRARASDIGPRDTRKRVARDRRNSAETKGRELGTNPRKSGADPEDTGEHAGRASSVATDTIRRTSAKTTTEKGAEEARLEVV